MLGFIIGVILLAGLIDSIISNMPIKIVITKEEFDKAYKKVKERAERRENEIL